MTDSPRQPPGAGAYRADHLALYLLGATQAAALACVPWVGRGGKEAADGAAVDAPMLYTGEEVGDGNGPAFELAIDPLEGTAYCASGLDGAISILAAGPPDSLWASVEQSVLMHNVVVGSGAVVRSAIIDKNVEVPPSTSIGVDHDADHKPSPCPTTGSWSSARARRSHPTPANGGRT